MLNRAHQKLADALINSKALRIDHRSNRDDQDEEASPGNQIES